ncbi:vacuolar protein sorting 25 isoform X2 [Tachypleus tridentatus]|uniref:vacuolar protein sorting 25 isoform X2 n=1 Tax=Tachypleus tridentatus TaxID=6853 RepID=UPI003FD1AD23
MKIKLIVVNTFEKQKSFGKLKMAEFDWPWQYNFPPFFTLQPNLATREKQLEAWRHLILEYHRAHKMHILDITEAQNSPLFYNKSLKRKLSVETIFVILEDLRKRGHIEWLDKQHHRCYIYWRTLEEWGKLIYKWASQNGMVNTVCTLYELTSGDDTRDEEFHGLEMDVFKKALRTLENEGRAELIFFDENEGVKFF